MTHPDPENLLELAALCEAAEGPDRELDAKIAVILSGDASAWVVPEVPGSIFTHKPGWWRDALDKSHSALAYSASLDAAITLVDAECYWQVGHDGEGRDPSMFAARVFDPLTMRRPCTAVSETAALALAAAALKARARSSNDQGRGK